TRSNCRASRPRLLQRTTEIFAPEALHKPAHLVSIFRCMPSQYRLRDPVPFCRQQRPDFAAEKEQWYRKARQRPAAPSPDGDRPEFRGCPEIRFDTHFALRTEWISWICLSQALLLP